MSYLMKSIEIFAGGGGLTLGVSNAGFKHVFLVEYDSDSVNTLRYNNKSHYNKKDFSWIHENDIHNVGFSNYQYNIDLLCGGPPCQPFSIGGKHQAYNDKRDLFSEASRALNEIRPKAFVFENVRGLLRKNFSKYFGYILMQLTHPDLRKKESEEWMKHLERLEKYHTSTIAKDIQYNVVFRLVNAADYGIPQKRERVIIVGFRSDINAKWSFPEPTHSKLSLDYSKWVSGEYWKRHNIKTNLKQAQIFNPSLSEISYNKKPWVTIRDVISDLPDPRRNTGIINHIYQSGARIYPGHTGSILDEPSKTIKAGGHGVPGGENMIVLDNASVRYLTVREAARIQTFPDDYIFPCSWTESMRQIGNAVPVKLGQIIADSVKETLKSSVWSNNKYHGGKTF